MMGRGLYGKLTDYMIGEADYVAHKRRERAIKRSREPGNNLRANDDEALTIDILGCRCERAGWVFFPWLKWHKEIVDDVNGLPDIGDFIDVKGITENSHTLLVARSKLKRAWAYLLVSAENHPYYWIAGWLWGHELAELAIPGPYEHRPSYRAYTEQLHPVYLLQRIARERS